MSEHELRKADDLLTELVELVETARAVPISGAAMVPREHVLDLLDDLREVLPPEMAEARRIVSTRDGLLAAAQAQADAVTTDSTGAARQRTEHAAAAAHQRGPADRHRCEHFFIKHFRVERDSYCKKPSDKYTISSAIMAY